MSDKMDELRRAVAQTLGEDPETWPTHGNAPLAIAAAVSLLRTGVLDAERQRLEVEVELDGARRKAFESLSRYKFWMFGYWAAVWVHLNRLSPVIGGRPSPFQELVKMARRQLSSDAAELSRAAQGEQR